MFFFTVKRVEGLKKVFDDTPYVEYRIMFPYFESANFIGSQRSYLSNIFDVNTGFAPIIPEAIRKLISPDASVTKARVVKTDVEDLDNDGNEIQRTITHTGFINQLHMAFGPVIDNPTKYKHELKIREGDVFYHVSGNQGDPCGTHTNIFNKNFNKPLFSSNAKEQADVEKCIADFMENTPLLDSVVLSSRAPVTASSMNGMSVAKYTATRSFQFQDFGKHVNKESSELESIYSNESPLRVLKIYAPPGHRLNEDFKARAFELATRCNGDPRCGNHVLVVETTTNHVDIITFHYDNNEGFADVHLNLFASPPQLVDNDDDSEQPLLVLINNFKPLFLDATTYIAQSINKNKEDL
jgi:hypothetical protein